MRRLRFFTALFLIGVYLRLSAANPASAADWLHWRGPEQNGVSREINLPEQWSDDPNDPNNNLIWKAPYGCRSTPLIHDGRIYIINNVGSGVTEQERVLALDGFDDDPKTSNEPKLEAIQMAWYEEWKDAD